MDNLKFNMIKLENHIVIQFNFIHPKITRKNTINIIKGGLRWGFRIITTNRSKNEIQLTRSGVNRRVKIILNPGNMYYGREIIGHRYGNLVEKESKEILKIKFKDNTERDYFYEAFIEFMDQKFRRKITVQ